MKVLIDMNLSPTWTGVLKEAEIDSVHWSQLGPANTPDPAIMAFAAANDFIILTNDLDFGAALTIAHRDKPSVVQIRGDNLRPASMGKQVCDALNQMRAELEMGAIITIDLKRTRLRILPLQRP